MEGYLKKIKAKQPNYVFRIPVDVYHPLEKTSLVDVIKNLERVLPPSSFNGVAKINLGKFQQLVDRNISAFSSKDQIFVSNELSLEQIIRAIVHELAHFVVKNLSHIIFDDAELEKEFISKRIHLYRFLKDGNHQVESFKLFINPRYSEKFDDFLYREIGYDYLDKLNLRYGYGPTVYSLTSLEEYFADGFEYFFLGEGHRFENTCKVLYNKLRLVLNNL